MEGKSVDLYISDPKSRVFYRDYNLYPTFYLHFKLLGDSSHIAHTNNPACYNFHQLTIVYLHLHLIDCSNIQQFWRSGPEINQLWFNVLCLLGWLILTQRRLICEAVCSHYLWEHTSSHTGSLWATGTIRRQLRARIYLAHLVSWPTQHLVNFWGEKQWDFTSMLKRVIEQQLS